MGAWTRVTDEAVREKALSLARGKYQRAIVLGDESLSGSTLPNAARVKWGGRYSRSRVNLLNRLVASGIPYGRELKGRRIILVIGTDVDGLSGWYRYNSQKVALPRIPRCRSNVGWRFAYFTKAGEAVVVSETNKHTRRMAVVNVEARTVRHARCAEYVTDGRAGRVVRGKWARVRRENRFVVGCRVPAGAFVPAEGGCPVTKTRALELLMLWLERSWTHAELVEIHRAHRARYGVDPMEPHKYVASLTGFRWQEVFSDDETKFKVRAAYAAALAGENE